MYVSASSPALTSPSPAPQRELTTISCTLPLFGLAVNSTPEERASTISWTTTATAMLSREIPFARR